jgi:hypothetical protein
MLKDLNIVSEFVDGRRVTDEKTMDVRATRRAPTRHARRRPPSAAAPTPVHAAMCAGLRRR